MTTVLFSHQPQYPAALFVKEKSAVQTLTHRAWVEQRQRQQQDRRQDNDEVVSVVPKPFGIHGKQ